MACHYFAIFNTLNFRQDPIWFFKKPSHSINILFCPNYDSSSDFWFFVPLSWKHHNRFYHTCKLWHMQLLCYDVLLVMVKLAFFDIFWLLLADQLCIQYLSSNFSNRLHIHFWAVETVKESRKIWDFYFDLQLVPTVLNDTFRYCQETGVISKKAQNFQCVG